MFAMNIENLNSKISNIFKKNRSFYRLQYCGHEYKKCLKKIQLKY